MHTQENRSTKFLFNAQVVKFKCKYVTEKNFIMNSRNPHEYWTYIQLAPIKYNNIELLLHFLSNELYKFSTICFTLIGKFTSLHNLKTFLCHLLPLMSHTLGTPLTTSLGAPNDFVMLQFVNNLNLGHFKYLATHDPCYRISKARTIFFCIFCKYQSTSSMSTFWVPNLEKPNIKSLEWKLESHILCFMIKLFFKKFSRKMSLLFDGLIRSLDVLY